MSIGAIINLIYLAAAVLFILGLKGMTHPRTAVRGNILGAAGMLLAVAITIYDKRTHDYTWIFIGLAIGASLGAVLALRVQMIAMPQMVALLNGLGGAASLLVASAGLMRLNALIRAADELIVVETLGNGATVVGELAAQADIATLIATVISGLIGGVTLSGSMVAYGKLDEKFLKEPLQFSGQQVVNAAIAVAAVALGAVVVFTDPPSVMAYWGVVLLSLGLGVLLTAPIGGADMPVVIALLNSYSGLAAAATGFVLGNSVLIIAGSLVGASGVILTQIMCKAMNRSLTNVLFGGLGATATVTKGDDVYAGKVKSAGADEIAMLFESARRVVIVPGYGLAVAQAQHAIRDLATQLEKRDIEVEYAIHPVAGRMPGHMNVLLAEANIPYDKLKEMDEVNPTFPETDVVLVIGANDVVNPVARTDPNSPIAGMPILNVDQARTVVVVKRSLSPGFAGIPNPLFAADNCLMFFNDGKKAVLELVQAMKDL